MPNDNPFFFPNINPIVWEAQIPNPAPPAAPLAGELQTFTRRTLNNGAVRANDPETGRSFRCLICRERWASTRIGTCDVCYRCVGCGRNATRSYTTRTCGECACCFCKKSAPLTNVYLISESGQPYIPGESRSRDELVDYYGHGREAGTHVGRSCGPCRAKRYGNAVVCKRCKVRSPVAYCRGDKKPSLCTNCVRQMGPEHRNVHYCSYCPNKATMVSRQYRVICAECYGLQCCFTAGCTPRKPCVGCAEQQKLVALNMEAHVADRERARIAPVRRNENRLDHLDAQGGECGPNCYACASALQRVWLEAPPEVRFHPAKDPRERRVNRSRRYIGVEVEVCGFRDPTGIAKLRSFVGRLGGAIVHDGSLPPLGFEINMPPMAGDHFITAMDGLGAHLAAVKAFVNTTYEPHTAQAGLHVHIDASDHTYADMRKLMFLYSVIEPALIRMQPYDRVMVGQDNGHGRMKRYCVPCGDRYKDGIIHLSQPKDKFKQALKSKVLRSVYDEDGAPPRKERHPRRNADVHYYALNVHSWFYRGTIECRLHTGTVDPEVIKNWGMLWANIVDSAYRMSEKDIRALMEPTGADHSIEVLLSLAPTSAVRNYINSRYDTYSADYGVN